MDKNTIWAWAIKNSIVMITWAALAIIFNKWWIALFAVLFMNSLETRYRHRRKCDGCGKYGPYGDSAEEALNKTRVAGWLHVVDGDRDYCPECRHNFENK